MWIERLNPDMLDGAGDVSPTGRYMFDEVRRQQRRQRRQQWRRGGGEHVGFLPLSRGSMACLRFALTRDPDRPPHPMQYFIEAPALFERNGVYYAIFGH